MEASSRQMQPKRQHGGTHTHTDTTRSTNHTKGHSDDFINKVLQIHRQTDENLRVFQDFEIRLRSLQHLCHSLATINQRYVDTNPNSYAPSVGRPSYMPSHSHASFVSHQRDKRPPTEQSPHATNPFERPTKVVSDVPVVALVEKDSSLALPGTQKNATAGATATTAATMTDAPAKRKRKSRSGPDVFCSLCGTTESQFWRRNGTNQRYCNACGLRMKTRALREAHASMQQAMQTTSEPRLLTALPPAPTTYPHTRIHPALASAVGAAVNGAAHKEVAWIDCLEESGSEQDSEQHPHPPAKRPRESHVVVRE
eukprot:GILJ01003290.1.p1 GENE.GILJ01003290.1~~GILJ01003290.1.p1  ORF type:complete len:328 (-),score=31.04 GILJ01003290.1:124-1059(-)